MSKLENRVHFSPGKLHNVISWYLKNEKYFCRFYQQQRMLDKHNTHLHCPTCKALQLRKTMEKYPNSMFDWNPGNTWYINGIYHVNHRNMSEGDHLLACLVAHSCLVARPAGPLSFGHRKPTHA
jgi:hypothetical protein